MASSRRPHRTRSATEADPELQKLATDVRAPTTHLSHLVSRSRGTRGRHLLLGMGVPVLRIVLVQVLLDALQDSDRRLCTLFRSLPPGEAPFACPSA